MLMLLLSNKSFVAVLVLTIELVALPSLTSSFCVPRGLSRARRSPIESTTTSSSSSSSSRTWTTTARHVSFSHGTSTGCWAVGDGYRSHGFQTKPQPRQLAKMDQRFRFFTTATTRSSSPLKASASTAGSTDQKEKGTKVLAMFFWAVPVIIYLFGLTVTAKIGQMLIGAIRKEVVLPVVWQGFSRES